LFQQLSAARQEQSDEQQRAVLDSAVGGQAAGLYQAPMPELDEVGIERWSVVPILPGC